MERLSFGYQGAPAATEAWGARLIVRQDGFVDFVPDRQDAIGDQAFLDFLEMRYPLWRLLNDVTDALVDRRIDTRQAAEVELYEDDDVRVVGNSNGSAGYFYVTAYAKASLCPGD